MVSSSTCAIFNVEYSNQVVDLKEGGQADGTPVVGYVFNRVGTNLHQRWYVEVLKTDAEGNITVHLTNNGNGNYLRVETALLNQGLEGSHFSMKWLLVKQGDSGKYFIKVPDTNFTCVLPNNHNYTQIKLAVLDESDPKQMWMFQEV
ncbi:uncharacterized protein F5891DRAFT_980040 [Suillus fuscotomentosus]|uniref:Ricin B lectin domain-containing protein n=1 Tax=Suillus fuscotomentosus TaxID=1912939 RepID=A0AAD4E7P0_9AGAM|nr:uncharacterized protein F5891DRAFT_980040 [Suillus fuscotomentosus]KAG1900826.1 hypothetical protein F5891DRAFT_980040 [Suillus fuscotomentosus]